MYDHERIEVDEVCLVEAKVARSHMDIGKVKAGQHVQPQFQLFRDHKSAAICSSMEMRLGGPLS